MFSDENIKYKRIFEKLGGYFTNLEENEDSLDTGTSRGVIEDVRDMSELGDIEIAQNKQFSRTIIENTNYPLV